MRETHTHRESDVYLKTSENHTEMKSEQEGLIQKKKEKAEFPLSQSREALILNCFMDLIFLLQSR